MSNLSEYEAPSTTPSNGRQGPPIKFYEEIPATKNEGSRTTPLDKTKHIYHELEPLKESGVYASVETDTIKKSESMNQSNSTLNTSKGSIGPLMGHTYATVDKEAKARSRKKRQQHNKQNNILMIILSCVGVLAVLVILAIGVAALTLALKNKCSCQPESVPPTSTFPREMINRKIAELNMTFRLEFENLRDNFRNLSSQVNQKVENCTMN